MPIEPVEPPRPTPSWAPGTPAMLHTTVERAHDLRQWVHVVGEAQRLVLERHGQAQTRPGVVEFGEERARLSTVTSWRWYYQCSSPEGRVGAAVQHRGQRVCDREPSKAARRDPSDRLTGVSRATPARVRGSPGVRRGRQ